MSTISFDCSGKNFSEDEWNRIMKQLDGQLNGSGLPGLYSDRWDDTECGCTFEGTPEEVTRVREILAEYPVTITCD